MHILEDRIAHIRPLRAVDFAEDESKGFSVERDQQFYPDQQASPLKLMVCGALFLDPAISFRLSFVHQRFPHPVGCCCFDSTQDVPRDPPSVGIENMDIDTPLSDAAEDYEEAEDDDDEREAPSEQDTDEAELDVQSLGGDSGHTQATPRDYGGSPLRGKALDFGTVSEDSRRHVTPLAEQPGDDRESDDHDEDEHDEDDRDDDEQERAEQEPTENKQTEQERGDEFDRVLSEAYHGRDQEGDVQVDDDPQKSEGSSPSVPSEDSEDDLPPPIPPRSKRSASRSSPKERQSRRQKPRVNEPAITESFLEDKIVGILSKTLPNMLTGLLQEAIGQVKIQPSLQAPALAPAVDVAVGPSEPTITIERVDPPTHEVGVQSMDVDKVDEATDMDALPLASKFKFNVSFHSPCDFVISLPIRVTESPPGCLIQVGDGAKLLKPRVD